MTRPLRVLEPDGIYHVTSRGNARHRIFDDDRDRAALLGWLGRTIRRFGWRCFAYCLMDNHFHLLVQTPEPNLPRGMQQLKSGHARDVNRRRAVPGHVFDGRYHAQLVQRDAHLLETFRYIALNPVKAGLCANPLDWRWSSHRALAGVEPSPAYLDAGAALRWFAAEPASAQRAYLGFVADGAVRLGRNGAVIGDDAFARRHLPDTRPSPEFAVKDWGPGRPPLSELLASGAGDEIVLAYRRHGYTLSAIANHLGCHVTTVSRRMRAWERMLDC